MKINRLFSFVLLLLFVAPWGMHGQSQKELLEQQKAAILKKIEETQRILKQTTSERTTSVGRLRALNSQITSRSSLIRAINEQVSALNEQIQEDQSIANAMAEDLKGLKEEYAQMVYATQKTSAGFNQITFLFAAETFNQLFMRMKYMRQYGEVRKKQAAAIEVVQENLNEQIAEIEMQKEDQKSLLNEELTESEKLQNLRAEQRQVVAALEREEQNIRKQLSEQLASEKELSERIDAIIEEERRRAASANAVNVEELTTAFEKEKGQLPWPVSEGFISSKYGRHKHPTLQRVTLNNKGIDIQTSTNAYVKTVFPGKVVGIQSIQGQGITVLMQHGDYYTAYSKLKAVTVSNGQELPIGSTIGQVLTNGDNVSELKFRIYGTSGTINPELWLKQSMSNQKPN